MSATPDGAADQERDAPSLKRPWHRALVQDFGPIWFTWCMNAGIIGILTNRYAYQFPGLDVLSTIAFMVDFVLYIVFSCIFILRFVWFRADAYRELADNTNELPLVACWPIAWMTLTGFVSLTVSNASWAGYPFTVVAYVMWWFGEAWVFCTLFFVFITLINRHNVSDRELPPSTVTVVIAVATSATIGGLVSTFSDGISARLAVPIMITCFFAIGVALFMATFLYTYLLHRMLARSLMPPDLAANMFILVGPLGQSGAALQILGSAADTYGRFGEYNRGPFLSASAAAPLNVACTLLGMLVLGMATVWLIMAFFTMSYWASKRQLHWSLSWNSIIFPCGTYTAGMEQLAVGMDSPFFKVVSGILIVFLVLVYLLDLVFTVWEVSKGRLLIVKEDPRARARMEEQEKQR